MYNMIEQVEPIEINSLENYLYFDNSEDQMIEEDNIPGIDQFVDNVDLLESMTHQDFSKLLASYSLSPATKHAYQTKFLKAKRIYKRDKAKTRTTAPCLKLLQPLTVETSESAGIKIETQPINNKETKQEEQKKRKRISAQLSRDKKKIYVQHIERENQELKQKCRQLEAENQKLKASSKTTSTQRKNSLKGCLQKEKEIVGIDSLTSKISVDSSYLFENVQHLVSQYEKYPISQRVLNLEKFKHFTELSQQKQSFVKPEPLYNFIIEDMIKDESKQQHKDLKPTTSKRKIKSPYDKY